MLLRRLFLTIIASLLLLAPAAHAAAQAASADRQGAAATGLALRRLGNTARVLHIAAHPDDENTALLSTTALGAGADAAYLSLTRGEGGQNSIGPELSEALGIVRSGELVAARRLDGGEQFFARAIDYGYSKNAEEAFRRWPHDELLADVVEVIRRYRPDVVVSVWSGTPLDGHGQHHASGIVAREAVVAAGDPARFPEQIAAGLRPHTPVHYYRSAFFSDRAPDVELNTGLLDPLLGRSYHQLAMASRSLHRSQDQGRTQEAGPRRTSFHRVDAIAGEPVAETRQFGRYGDGAPTSHRSLFEGVDTLLSQRAARAARTVWSAGSDLGRVAAQLSEYEAQVARVRRDYSALEPWRILPGLIDAQRRLVAAAGLIAHGLGSADPAMDRAVRDLHFHLAGELADLRDAILAAANIQVDVTADQEWIVPGQQFRLELGVWNGGPAAVRAQAGPLLPAGWAAEPLDDASDADDLTVPPGQRAVVAYRVTVPTDAEYDMPYYLDPAEPTAGAMYRWPDDADVRTLPFAPGTVRGSFLLLIDDASPVALDREAARVLVDRRSGEFRRPVKVVPAASVTVEPGLAMVRLDRAREATEVVVRVRSHSPGPITGAVRLDLPAGWSARPDRVPVTLDGPDADGAATFRVTPPASLAPGEYHLDATLVTDRGEHTLGFQVIDYPHVEPRHLYEPARVRVRALDVQVAPVRVGFVAGTGDGVPDALDRLGVDWQPVLEQHLANGDLDRFDVIVVGVRAYELRPDLLANNQRLLDWTRRGGTLVVQYQQYGAVRDGFAPWPVTIARPHGRVTNENAPVQLLEPGHPALNVPNRIGHADWEGWVQERGLYFLDSWDGPFTPLVAMSDPGEDPLTGGLLVAPLGSGTYVYTGLALFRQLPQGVPGAYRLLANLISLGATP